MRKYIFLSIFISILTPVAFANNEQFLREARRAISVYFKDSGLMPVVLSASISPGDVLSWDSWMVDEAASHCFPNLQIEPPAHIELPQVSFRGSMKASFLVALGEFLNLRAGGDREFTVHINYTDAKLTEVTRGNLRRTLSEECERLEPVLREEPWSNEKNGVPPLIVGKVVTAKQSVFIVASAKISAEIASDIAKLVGHATRVINVADPKLSAEFGVNAQAGIIVESQLELPVAVVPAFLFGRFPERRGPGAQEDPRIIYAAREFDPANPEHIELFELTIEGVLGGSS